MKSQTLKNIVLCFCLVFLFSADTFAQRTTEEGIRIMKSYLFDASFTPYRLEATANGRGFQFCNTSKKHLEYIQLGCVKRKKNAISVLSEREIINWDDVPKESDSLFCNLWIANHGFFPDEECQKGKLALIKLAFEDGTTWKLNE